MKLSNNSRFIGRVGIIWLLIATMIASSGISQAHAAPSNHPNPLHPMGNITDRTPTYEWTKLAGASHYQVQLRQGTTVVYTTGAIPASNCGASTCTFTPINSLNYLLAYKWHVRERSVGVWGAYSAYKSFIVNPPGFDSQFTNNASGWAAVDGAWSVAEGLYQSTGVAGETASTKYNMIYGKLTFTIRIKRTGCSFCFNSIFVRGSGMSGPGGIWTNGYRFGIDDGFWELWKYESGAATLLGTGFDAAINGIGEWNTIKAIANGSTLKFYVNNVLMHTGTHTEFATGRVGVGFDRDADPGTLVIDWAKLVP